MTVTYVQISMYCCLLIIPFILWKNFGLGNQVGPIRCWFIFIFIFIFVFLCFQCPYEGGEGVWVQDNNPGTPERNGCMVAEVFGGDHTN